jgi:hypothetical protein
MHVSKRPFSPKTLHNTHFVSAQAAADAASLNNTHRFVNFRAHSQAICTGRTVSTDYVLQDLPFKQLIIIWPVQKFPVLRNKNDSLPCSKNYYFGFILCQLNLNRIFKTYSCIKHVHQCPPQQVLLERLYFLDFSISNLYACFPACTMHFPSEIFFSI